MTGNNSMLDLIYAGEDKDEMQQDFEARWDATCEDASDFIHMGRFEATFDCDDKDVYLLWLFATGIFLCSFYAQGERLSNPERYLSLMRQAVALTKAKANE